MAHAEAPPKDLLEPLPEGAPRSAELASGPLTVELVYCPAPRQVRQCCLSLPAGATVADALAASGWTDLPAITVPQEARVGIWGRRVALSTPLHAQDRIEIYRPLTVDPKEARRQRYRAHGEKLPKGIHRPRTAGRQAPS